ncbi:MAG: 2-amino-4-hydroxy-6-hydroxymethyldihydropteridine diphosphokinase [Pseudomonadota bacterium]
MILLGLGSSLSFCGSAPQETLRHAIRSIGCFATVTAVSRFYASPAWPDPLDPPFVNAAIAVKSDLSPEALLAALHQVEDAFGRERHGKNAPRTLDLDLLSYNRVTGLSPALPHPGIASRDFVLAPLLDIAPGWVSPTTGLTPGEMLAALGKVTATPIGR